MPVERKHGTRAKYVGDKCRCDECRGANREYAKTRSVRAIEAAAAIPKGKQRKTVTKHMPWSGQTVKFRKVVCAGVEGKPCPRRTVLKRNSTGGVCSDCRERLAKIQIPTVSEVKKHLAFLSKNGIGTRAVQKAARVSYATLRDIKNGIAKRVTVEVESRILAVTTKDFADGALVPSDEAWELIGKLRKMGMPKVAIARKLGNKGGGLQINKKRVIHRTLQDLRLIYEQALKDKEREELLNSICGECGLSHLKRARQERLRKILPLEVFEIMEAYPCLYQRGSFGTASFFTKEYQMLLRDLKDIGAKKLSRGRSGGSVWGFPE
jgi:hypothetical protein